MSHFMKYNLNTDSVISDYNTLILKKALFSQIAAMTSEGFI